jgi:hypothetical protein
VPALRDEDGKTGARRPYELVLPEMSAVILIRMHVRKWHRFDRM